MSFCILMVDAFNSGENTLTEILFHFLLHNNKRRWQSFYENVYYKVWKHHKWQKFKEKKKKIWFAFMESIYCACGQMGEKLITW